MRAIDADALLEHVWRDRLDSRERIADLVKSMPTIRPERKKGRWIPQDLNKHFGMASTAVYYYPKCSVCGRSADCTNFCPNCGADMR